MILRDSIPSRDEYAARFGLLLKGGGTNVTGPCGVHGGSDSASFHVDGRWQCFACSAKGGDMLDYHRQVHNLSVADAARDVGAWQEGKQRGDGSSIRRPAKVRPVPQARAKHETLSPYGRDIWDACRPIHGIARDYLMARRCMLPPQAGDLACHPALPHRTGYVGPALVGLVTDAVTGEPISLHRTWVAADGKKAAVDPPRLLLGGHRKQGGVIRLWPDEDVTTGLMVGEGIETVLTAARHYRPAWASIDAGNLAALPVLPGVEVLVIAADNDKAGLKAANECADRWTNADVQVLSFAPIREGADWNDVAKAAA